MYGKSRPRLFWSYLELFSHWTIYLLLFIGFFKHSKHLGITRLVILSRPKAPKILQELLSNSRVLGQPSYSKIPKDSKRFQRIPKDSKRAQKIPKDCKKIPKDSKRIQKITIETKRLQLKPKDYKRFQEILKRFQKILKDSIRFQKDSKRFQKIPKDSRDSKKFIRTHKQTVFYTQRAC